VEKRSKSRIKDDVKLKEILGLAIHEIKENGIRNLSIQQIINKSSMSRMTFFKLIPNKETLITHLGISGINQWLFLMNRPDTFDGMARERLVILHASQVITAMLHNQVYQAIFMANAEVNRGQVYKELNAILDDRINKFVSFYCDCIKQAISEGNLKLKSGYDPKELAMFFWASRYGATVTRVNFLPSGLADGHQLSSLYNRYFDLNLDSLDWRPLSCELHYDRVLKSIFKHFYADEISHIKIMFDEKYSNPNGASLLTALTQQHLEEIRSLI
jgi:AcrR family transcriptional regulator